MKVEKVMNRDVASCGPRDDLARAAQIMREQDCGCVPVLEGDGASLAVGMVTDRDVCMAAYTTGKSLAELSVGEFMARQLACCHPEDSIEDAERIMSQAQVRRLPVINADGALVGILSLADLARQTLPQPDRQAPPVSDVEIGSTLTSISQPHGLGGDQAVPT